MTVGELRQQTSLCDGVVPVIIVNRTKFDVDFVISDAYPDTMDDKGHWGRFFKIVIKEK